MSIVFLAGDIFGFLALGFIVFTAVFMLLRKKLLKLTRNLDLLRKIHIYSATGAGVFLILHAAYFMSWPLTSAILLGYVSATIAGIVWLTGTAFLERFKDSLFLHNALSIGAISLMLIHAGSAGINFPILIGYAILLFTTLIVIYKASQYATKMLKSAGIKME